MPTFSRVIARPTALKRNESTVAPSSSSQESIWSFDPVPTLHRFFGGNTFSSTLTQNNRGACVASQPPSCPFSQQTMSRDLSPSPPLLVPDDDSTESPNDRSSSSPDLLSPPSTACSTVAVLGSPGFNRTFEDDYDRPEANPNFLRHFLRRSRSFRRQARMRDGDFRDTDEELDYSVTSEKVTTVIFLPADFTSLFAPESSLARPGRAPATGAASVGKISVDESTIDSRTAMTPSRVSQRRGVKPLAPIDTQKKTLRDGVHYESLHVSKYAIEGGYVAIGPPSAGSESGFEADDEGGVSGKSSPNDVQRFPTIARTHVGAAVPVLAPKPQHPGAIQPCKRSYAAVVASSSPESHRSVSRTGSVVGVPPTLKVTQHNPTSSFVWHPFTEPLDG
ncbi:hypothetical protein C8Q80DRAFT_1266376 [Daedaleopsis nitida]|nr:hypothetical protein C8Q80DRAFT_1266376 [Daedaleopsis nitida]